MHLIKISLFVLLIVQYRIGCKEFVEALQEQAISATTWFECYTTLSFDPLWLCCQSCCHQNGSGKRNLRHLSNLWVLGYT